MQHHFSVSRNAVFRKEMGGKYDQFFYLSELGKGCYLGDFTRCSGVSIIDFEQVNAGWVDHYYYYYFFL